MEAEDSRTKISRLEGTSDWASWKFQMQIILEANEYADFISGEEPKPQRIPRAGETDAETDARFNDDLKIWKLKDAKWAAEGGDWELSSKNRVFSPILVNEDNRCPGRRKRPRGAQ
ncbi:hypothetical protein GE061_001568 [Apolygus lucorum]|uniref:Uncharacterized protein n=1 Tax=Apolygus lucorum TaxID=248454 RepID=A0A8S9Y944_APOLU|nr:hypothetical protein GE061_001568 [Apolygus lucorum]